MDYAQQQRNPAKHLIGFTIVVLLHVALVYALINGLGRAVVDVVKKYETKIVKEVKQEKPPETPPPPPPKLAPPPPPFIPPPEINIALPMTTTTAITSVTTKPPPAPQVIAPQPRVQTKAALDRSSCPSPEPAYPMASRRNQETGTVVLRFLIDVSGALNRVEIAKSSGHTRLDEAAKAWIASCRFKAGTEDNKPVQSWATQAYTFNLRD